MITINYIYTIKDYKHFKHNTNYICFISILYSFILLYNLAIFHLTHEVFSNVVEGTPTNASILLSIHFKCYILKKKKCLTKLSSEYVYKIKIEYNIVSAQ